MIGCQNGRGCELDSSDVFGDMLVGDETVVAQLGAPGPNDKTHHQWWQLAITPYRLLAVQMKTSIGTRNWIVTHRWAMEKTEVRLAQYPRTEQSVARLEAHGFPQSVVLIDIDQQDVHPHLPAFLSAWARPVEGVSKVTLRHELPTPKEQESEHPKLLVLVGAAATFVFVCCGCGTIAVAARDLITALF